MPETLQLVVYALASLATALKYIPPMDANHTAFYDTTALRRAYLIGDAFTAKYLKISRDHIWQEQNEAFKRLLARAWRMQFYRRLWSAHGVKSGDIRSLLDIDKLPIFDAQTLNAATDNAFAPDDLLGLDSYGMDNNAQNLAPPIVETFFGPRSVEIKHLLCARADLFQGESENDVAQLLSSPQSDRATLLANWKSANGLARYSSEMAGLIAVEGLDHDGQYVMEDAQYLELLTPNGTPADYGAPGSAVITSLYKDDICPLIRFNTHDIAAECLGESSFGLNLRRIRLQRRP